MEEDLKVLKEFVNQYNTDEDLFCFINYSTIQAIENLIKGYKELDKENTRQHELLGKIHEKYQKDYIPKSKVREVRNKFAEMVQKMYAGKKEITDHDVFILFDELLEGDK